MKAFWGHRRVLNFGIEQVISAVTLCRYLPRR